MSRAGERRRLLIRRGDIFRELTQMSYKGWSGDYRPLESELDRIKARLALIKEMNDHLSKSEALMHRYKELGE